MFIYEYVGTDTNKRNCKWTNKALHNYFQYLTRYSNHLVFFKLLLKYFKSAMAEVHLAYPTHAYHHSNSDFAFTQESIVFYNGPLEVFSQF